MRNWKRALLGLGASALLSTGAMAADVMAPIAATPPPPAAPIAAPGFDWAGLFIGAFGSVNFETGLGLSWYNAGGQIGYNFVRGSMLVGATLQAGGWFVPGCCSGALIQGNARVGFVRDRLLIYALAGIGTYPPGSPHVDVGAGVEVAAGDRLSVFGEARYEYFVGGGPPPHFIRLEFGLNLHPGN
jgi:hypothetical protein